MAKREVRFTDNGLGLWKSEDGHWGVFDRGEDEVWRWRLQRNRTGDPWDWEIVDHLRTFEEAVALATEIEQRRWT